MFYLLGFLGVYFLFQRLRSPQPVEPQVAADTTSVSIIVPARNEEHNLPKLMASLAMIEHKNLEVIVVDDESTDETFNIAESYADKINIRVFKGQPKPEGFGGKQWACWQGAQIAKGDYFVFTDADVTFYKDTLDRAFSFVTRNNIDMATALPWHECKTTWEKLTGPFQVMLLGMTRPFGIPRKNSVFAIGQFLVFSRKSYFDIGGHESVKHELVEDIPLAMRYVTSNWKYGVIPFEKIFKVRMYDTFGDFVRGWRRNFRAGMSYSGIMAPIEVTAYIAAITGAGFFLDNLLSASLMLLSAAILIDRQRSIGQFHVLGALLAPFSVLLFVYISGLALADRLCKRSTPWKDRLYLGS